MTSFMSFLPAEPSAVSVEVQDVGPRHLMRRMPPHAHLFFELLLVTKGHGSIAVGGRELAVAPRTVIALPPGVQHDCRRLGAADAWSIIFLPEGAEAKSQTAFAVDEQLPSGITFDIFRLRALEAAVPIALDAEAFETALGLTARMRNELRARADGYDLVVRNALQMLLITVAREAPAVRETSGPLSLESRDFLGAVFGDIDRHYGESASLRAIAKRLNVQAGHLTTKLKRLTGRTYTSWLIERRMIEARRLLAESTLSLAEITERIGYAETESFVRRFRTHHAVTPGVWRSKAREERIAVNRNIN